MGFGNKLVGGGSISDIEFIRKKILSGDWISITGPIDALNDVLSYVVPNGKTFFFYESKVSIVGHNSPTTGSFSNAVQANLLVDGVVKDTIDTGFMGNGQLNSSANGWAWVDSTVIKSERFSWHGSLVGDGIKTVQIKNVLDNGNAIATLEGWIEDT